MTGSPNGVVVGGSHAGDGRARYRTTSTLVAVTEIESRELGNNTEALLDRVEAGETVTITVDGRPVALLGPVARRPRWLSCDEFVRRVLPRQADASLGRELRALAPDTTDNVLLK